MYSYTNRVRTKVGVSFIIAASLSIVAFIFSPTVSLAISGTFTATQTVANVVAGSDNTQAATYATTQANVTTGADTQTFTLTNVTPNDSVVGGNTNEDISVSNTIANVVPATSTITVDTDIVVTADTIGTAGNNLSIEVAQSDVAIGDNASATIAVSKTGDAILVTVQHNSSLLADGTAPINVTRQSVVDALNMTSSGTVQGGKVTVTITNDVTANITATGGSATKVGTVAATSLASGVNAVAQVTTFTPVAPEVGDVFTISINGTNYTFTATTIVVADVVAGLQPLADAHAAVSCTNETTHVACTAVTAGTAFTTTGTTATNKAAVKQVDDITPSNIEVGDTFQVSGVATSPVSVVATDSSAATLVNALVTAINNAAGAFVEASNESNKLRLTADVAGTAFTATPSVTNRASATQVNTITIGGTIEVGDVFTATLPTVGAVTFTAADTDANNVATGLNAAILASSGYLSQDFTSAVSTNVITLTAKVSGAGFTASSNATNKPAVAQVVTFTPANIIDGETFRATLNGSANLDYTVVDTKTVKQVVEGIVDAMDDAEGAVSCTEDDTKVTCTADAAGTSFTHSATVVDITDPTVTITDDETGTANIAGGDVTFTFTFSESVTGFETGDVVVAGGTKGTFSGSGSVYTLVVTPTASSTANITVDVAGDVATDAATNGNTAAAQATQAVDTISPIISSITSNATATGELKIGNTILFTLTPSITEAGATVTGSYNGTSLTWSTANAGVTYTATYTVTSGHTDRATALQISGVTLTDAGGNVSASAGGSDIAKTIDANVPTFDSAETTSTTTIEVTFSEDLLGTTVTNSDFSVAGNTLTTPDATEISAGVVRLTLTTPITTGATPAVSYSGSVTDLAGNAAPTAGPITPTDSIDPTVTITDDESGVANIAGGNVTYTFTFSEAVTGFATGDISVIGGTKSTFTADSTTVYTLVVTPDEDSTTSITVDVDADSANDGSTNGNVVATQSVQTVDTLAPTVSITDDETGTANIANGDVVFTFTFSEAVTGFTTDDISVAGGAKSTFTASSTTVYTLAVTPASNSTSSITVDVADTVAIDANSNDNDAATQATQTVDTIAPALTITDDETGTANIAGGDVVYTFTFSEAVTGFAIGDITVANGTKGAFNASSATVYTLAVTPASNSTSSITVDVAGSVAIDAAGNNNTAATQSVQTVSTVAPSVTITDDETSVANIAGGNVTFTFTFSESVNGFEAGDVTVGGGTKGAFSGSGSIYTLAVTPTTNSTSSITVDVASGVATSSTNNNNTAATQATQAVDTKTPTLTVVTVASNNASTTLAKTGNVITLSITASESITTPTVTIRGNAASVSGATNSWSATYTMQSGDTEGTIPFTVSFSDVNGNPGTQVTAITAGSNVVFDRTLPTITLVGESFVNISRYATYVDAGATATDTHDGTITSSIATTSTVDTEYVGKYSVSYTVSDAAGNSAVSVSRTVKVNSGSSGGSNSTPSQSVVNVPAVPSNTPFTAASVQNIASVIALAQNLPSVPPSHPQAAAIAQAKAQVVILLVQLVTQLQAELDAQS